jgi:hypothetical protein
MTFAAPESSTPGNSTVSLKLSTILGKMANNNGGTRGVIIKRAVTLKEENLSWEETWYISHADAMKVVVEGKTGDEPWKFEILYKGGKRTTPSTDGKAKSFPISPEFYEPLLHYRSARALTSKLVSMQVLPTWAAQNPDTTNTDSFLNLERFKGIVADVLGSTETKNTQAPPRVWIEQDSFVVRKVRLGSQVEVEFSDVKEFEEGKIKMPEQQSVFWKNATVLLQNKSVEFVDQKKIEPHLKLGKGETAKLPDNVNIKEFYSRFR